MESPVLRDGRAASLDWPALLATVFGLVPTRLKDMSRDSIRLGEHMCLDPCGACLICTQLRPLSGRSNG